MDVEEQEEDDDVEEEKPIPRRGSTLCASLHSRNVHGQVTIAILCRNLQEKMDGGHLRGQRFVRACAVEMHTGISQEPFCAEIYRKNAGRPETTSIKHQA